MHLFVFDLIFAQMAAWEESIEVACSEGKDSGNESVFSKHFDFILGDAEVTRVDLVLSIYTNKRNQSRKLSFVVKNNLKSLFDLIMVKYDLRVGILDLGCQLSDNLLINLLFYWILPIHPSEQIASESNSLS